MYKDIGDILGLNYEIIEPYYKALPKNYDYIIVSKGYSDRIKKLNDHKPLNIIEVKSATFSDLIETLKDLNLIFNNKNKNNNNSNNSNNNCINDIDNINNIIKNIDNYINLIKKTEKSIKSLNYPKIKVYSPTEFITKIFIDLQLPISKDGVWILPEYLKDRNSNVKDPFHYYYIKTHRYDLNTLNRIKDRYLSIIHILNQCYIKQTK